MAKSKKSRRGVQNLIVVSDLHAGCKTGLYPCEHPVPEDLGVSHSPSPLQRAIWSYWREFWDAWVPQVTRGEPYAVVVNGDALDGVHHNSNHQITHNLADQAKIALALLAPVRDACDGRLYMVRGTEAHVGSGGQHEEQLALALGAVPDEAGQHSRFELWVRIGRALVHCLHHIGTTSSSAHEASAVNAELTAEFVEAARWKEEPPHYVVRSHRHRAIVVDIDCADGYAAGIVTPGWQGKTPFSYKIAGARISLPQWGGFLIRQGDEEHYYRRRVWRPQRGPVTTPRADGQAVRP